MCVHLLHPEDTPSHQMSAQTGEQAAGGVQENQTSSESCTYFPMDLPLGAGLQLPWGREGFLAPNK